MKIGLLTGGHDVPGLNAAIRAVVRRAAQYQFEVIGIHNGWAGLMGKPQITPLTPRDVAGILPQGGTILGCSRTNPFARDLEIDAALQQLRSSGQKKLDKAIADLEAYQDDYVKNNINQIINNVHEHGLDVLIVLGGRDTLRIAARLVELGLPIIGIPKTMDNDLPETDYCIGFDSAVTRVVTALDNLHTTAMSHHRVMVVEVMGRDTGWVALEAGLAGGADYIAIPEVSTTVDEIVNHVQARREAGKTFSIIVLAHGATIGGITPAQPDQLDPFGVPRFDKRATGQALAQAIEARLGVETRTVVIGYLHRGGSPTVFDRVLATRLGVAAVDLARAGNIGQIPVMKDNQIVPVPLAKVAGATKQVPASLIELASLFFGRQTPLPDVPRKRIGVLTGGGDCPGLNAAIRAVARRAFQYGWEVIGIKNGWAGLLDTGESAPLAPASVSGILHLGGTILGTSRTNPTKKEDQMRQVEANFKRLGLDALVAIGGDDTLSVATRLHQKGLPVVGVPKTMDNDIAETDYCIGFDSAVTTVVEALDRLHTTAAAHHRAMVVEVMGRDAGWVAVVGGLAGGADYIFIPEIPGSLQAVCDHLLQRKAQGKLSSIIVVSEGAKIEGLEEAADLGPTDAFGHVRLDKRGLAERLCNQIEACTQIETRFVVLGHIQRGGSPTLFDRVLATRTAVAAVDLIRQERYGYVPMLKGNQIVPVELERAIAYNRGVDRDLYDMAKIFF